MIGKTITFHFQEISWCNGMISEYFNIVLQNSVNNVQIVHSTVPFCEMLYNGMMFAAKFIEITTSYKYYCFTTFITSIQIKNTYFQLKLQHFVIAIFPSV